MTPNEQQAVVPSWQAKYRKIAVLGSGGVGRTMKVEDINSGRVCCLKELLPTIDWRPLQQECRALARLTHPNVVRLLDFDTHAIPAYLVTEYIEGATLSEQLHKQGAMSEKEVVGIAQSLVEAVAYLHTQDVIHRDLKPQNIMLRGTRGIDPVIIDFGLAIIDFLDQNENLTAEGCCMGTPSYMAPEQAAGELLSTACDVYQLGQIMWEILAGQLAFTGRSVQAIMSRKVTSPQLELPNRVKVSKRMKLLVRRCTDATPKRRPTPDQMLETLGAIRDTLTQNGGRRGWWQFWK